MWRVSYGTLFSVIFIYNFRTTSSIFTKISGSKRSGMEKRPTKFRRQQTVAIETVSNFCFSSMTDISVGGQPIVLKFWQSVLLMQRYNLCTEHNFVRLTDFLIQSKQTLE